MSTKTTPAPKAPTKVAPKAPTSTYQDLSLAELTDLALEQGKSLSGNETEAELIELLTGESVLSQETAPKSAPVKKAPAKTVIEEATEEDGDVLPWVLMDKDFYKAHFAKSEKIRVIIPVGVGEAKEYKDSQGKVKYPVEVVSINGYAISIRKGVYVNVPVEFATIIEQYTNFAIESPLDLTNADDKTLEALN
jgi:hypothetical protein